MASDSLDIIATLRSLRAALLVHESVLLRVEDQQRQEEKKVEDYKMNGSSSSRRSPKIDQSQVVISRRQMGTIALTSTCKGLVADEVNEDEKRKKDREDEVKDDSFDELFYPSRKRWSLLEAEEGNYAMCRKKDNEREEKTEEMEEPKSSSAESDDDSDDDFGEDVAQDTCPEMLMTETFSTSSEMPMASRSSTYSTISDADPAARHRMSITRRERRSSRPYHATENTKFVEYLAGECMAVVKDKYFQHCVVDAVVIQDRSRIPAKFFIKGDQVVNQWQIHGAKFLIVISYAWLEKGTPDPDMFHVRRLARVLKEFKRSQEQMIGAPVDELGIIMDYCSLWQKLGNPDTRTPHQLQQFQQGLSEIDTPYAHKDVTAIKLLSVPETVPRKYDDRGWTLFESVLIDGKAASAGMLNSKQQSCGYMNTLSVGDSFHPDCEEAEGWEFVEKFSKTTQHQPPLTPDRFQQEMNARGRRARAMGADLFTTGKDQPFVLEKYTKVFAFQARAEKFHFYDKKWDDDQIGRLAEVLTFCHDLKELTLSRNLIGDAGAEKLFLALQALVHVNYVAVNYNQIADAGAEKIAEALPKMANLNVLKMESNKIGDIGAKAIARALPFVPTLTTLRLHKNLFSAAAEEMLRNMALPALINFQAF